MKSRNGTNCVAYLKYVNLRHAESSKLQDTEKNAAS